MKTFCLVLCYWRLSLLSNDPDPERLYPYAFHRSVHNLFWHQKQAQLYIRVCPIFEIERVSEFLSPITVLSSPHWLSYLWLVTILSCLFVCLFIVCSRSTFLCCWSVDRLLFCHVFSCLFLSHFPSCFHLVSRYVMVWLCWYSCCCCCRQLFKKRFVDFSLYSSWGLHFLLLFHCIICHCLSLFVNTFAPVFFLYISCHAFFVSRFVPCFS